MNRTGALIASAILLAGCAGVTSGGEAIEEETTPVVETTTTQPAEPTPEETTEEPVVASDPEGDFEQSCDYLLDFDNGHTFVASAFITNTGDVGFKAKVKATWRQANGKHVTDTKTVKVPEGDEVVEVYFEEKASSRQIDSIQALDTEKQCKVDVTITDLL